MEKTIREATRGISEEFRSMDVGEIVRFPVSKYRYSTIRSTPSASLVNERMEGKRWKTRVDYPNKCIEVTRIA